MAEIQAHLDDGRILSFPEGTDPDVIRKTVKSLITDDPKPSPPSVGRDVSAGAASGIVKGSAGLVGMPSDIMTLADKAWQYGMTELAKHTGLLDTAAARKGITPDQAAEQLRAPMAGIDTPRAMGSQDVMGAFQSAADAMPGQPKSLHYQPQTIPGQYAKTTGEFVAGAIPQGPMGMLKYAIPSALTSETAGQLTKGTGYETPARIVGGIVGGVPGFLSDLRTNGQNVIAESFGNLTPQQQAQAQSLLESSRRAGAPLTVPEAIQQVTGGATRLGDVQRVVEQSAKGGDIMKPFYAARPSQNEALARNTFDQLGAAPNPYEVAPAVQASAKKSIDDIRQGINAASKPAYDATTGNPSAVLSPNGFSALTANNAVGDAIKAVRADPIKYGDLSGLKDNSLGVLDAVKKYMDDVAGQAKTSGANFAASNATGAADTVKNAMVSEFPRYGSALNIQATGRRYLLDPAERAPIGQLAAADTFPKQSAILFAPNPLPGSSGAIGDAVRSVAKTNPEAAQGLVRMKVEQTFNEATQALRTGQNQFGGAGFAAVIKGNPQQAANLEAAVKALPGGATRWQAMKNMFDIFEAQGTRQPMGSATEFNRSINESLRGGTAVGEAISTAASPTKAMGFFQKMYDDYRFGKNTEALAQMFTQGDVKDLAKIAMAPKAGDHARLAIGNVGSRYLYGVGGADQSTK